MEVHVCLDMGEPIKVLDLVQRYVEMKQTKMPQIIITGTRKGEKISTDLLDTAENLRETSHRVDQRGRRSCGATAEGRTG